MSKFVSTVYNYIRPLTKYAWLLVVVVLIVLVGYYGYSRFAKPIISKDIYKDVANANTRGKNADIYFFHVDWCPHCKKAAPEWQKFQSEYNGKSVNGYTIITHDIDCTADSANNTDTTIASLIEKYDIQGYPTIKITTDDGKTIDFESKITQKSLETFVNNVL